MEARNRPRAAATIGVFDGVHRGHQELLRRVVAAARVCDGVAVAVAFARHPLELLDPGRCPAPLTTAEERRALLLAQGIDEVLMLEFDRAIAKESAREFLESVLLGRYELKTLVVGPDFAMGRNRAGDVAALRALGEELGFSLEVVEPIQDLGGVVSSTRLRGALAAGLVDVARDLLGRDYVLSGTVVSGHGRGRELGFPTANVEVEERRMLPGDGVYAALARVGGYDGPGAADSRAQTWPPPDSTWRPAVVNVGLAPTFGEGERRVEVHLLDQDPGPDLGGQRIEIRFVARMRGEVRFPDVAALSAQIRADVAAARALLAALPARTTIG